MLKEEWRIIIVKVQLDENKTYRIYKTIKNWYQYICILEYQPKKRIRAKILC